MNKSELGLQTRAVHAGEQPDPVTGASSPNLVMSTTYVADPDTTFSAEGFQEEAPHIYTRWSNPTLRQLEEKLCALEEAEACVVFASGMAAISALMFHELKPGDRLVISDVTYAGAAELVTDLKTSVGVDVVRVNMSDLEEVQEAVNEKTRLVYAETPANPILRLTDISAVAEIAHSVGARLAVDSTFATPIATLPLELGADYVIHSLTKYLSGHGDTLGGALLGPAAELARVRQRLLIHMGGILSPFNAWLIMRGMATLPLRMAAHQQTATQTAKFLEGHPKVTRVVYPGLPSHPQHTLASRQMRNYSGMVTFQVEDGARAARVLAKHLRIVHYAVSLGHHRSLVFYLPTSDMLASSFPLNPAQAADYRRYAGDGIFRFSVGIEDAEDICADLEQTLNYL